MARVRTLSVAVVFATLAPLTATALAKPPAALDRLPGDASLVVALRSVGDVHSRVTGLASTFGAGDAIDLGPIDDLIASGLLNLEGSAGLALTFPDGNPTAEPDAIALIPVTDYEALLETLGAEMVGGVARAQIEGEDGFLKSVGGGYAIVAPTAEQLAAFDGAAGNLASHGRRMGPTGRRIADESDVVVILDVETFAPMIRQGIDQAANNMAGAGAMMGPADQMQAQIDMMRSFGEALASDGQSVVVGADLDDAGIRLDAGLQFKEGTEWAGYLDGRSDSSSLLARLPSQPYLYAFAADLSAPGLKRAAKQFMPEDGNPMGGMGVGFLSGLMDQVDGEAVIVGNSPAGLMGGGLFINTVTYYHSKDPVKLKTSLGQTITKLNDVEMPGMTMKSSYSAESQQQLNGADLHEWSLSMLADGQGGMMMMQLFGPTGGPNGYLAQTESGVVMTMSKNRSLTGAAIEAANTGDGSFADETTVEAVAASLPEGRFVEGYLGVRDIAQTVVGFLPMMLGKPVDVQVPDDLPPLGMGGVADDGGVRFSMYATASLVEFASEMATVLQGMGGQFAPGPQENNARPRF